MPDNRTDEEIDADVAVRYLKRLKLNGVDHSDALTMTTSYMSSRVMGRNMGGKPPWQE